MSQAPATATEGFARFAVELELDQVPAQVREAARLHLLDLLGCGLLACAEGAADYVGSFADAPSGPATGIGFGAGLPADQAALVNGIRCHALDFDDTHPRSIAHVSAVVAPAAIASAQAAGGDGPGLLRALVAANEITCRIGRPVGDEFHHRGFHPTAICGVFGATTAAGLAAGLSEHELVQAYGIAGSMAGGLMAYLSDGSATKPVHAGWMAHAGIYAARLAAAGATGPAAVLEGMNGVYPAFVGLERVEAETLTADLGSDWETLQIAFKPYAACHFIHAPLDALLLLREEHGFGAEEIEAITFVSPRAGIELTADPIERKRRPQTPYEAKFSGPFALAAALVTGRTDPLVYSGDFLASGPILALTERVEWEAREYETFPESLPGGVKVELRDGTQLERHLAHQRGGGHNPMGEAEVTEKFRANAAGALPPEQVEALREAVLGLESERSLAFVEPLAGAGRRP